MKHQTRPPNLLIIAFDDQKTDLDEISDRLKQGTFYVKGKPVWLKTYPEPIEEN